MKNTFILLLSLLAKAVSAQETALANKLEIGDLAPSIIVAKWLKGNEVKAFESGKIYIVEFWATWCLPCIAGMPHLSDIARKYKDQVTVAGISILERKDLAPGRLERFVDSMGSKMDYNVATEDKRAMTTGWLYAAGERGIPCAFIVDGQQRIAWIGLPAYIDTVMPSILKGSWDITLANKTRKEKQRLEAFDVSIIPLMNAYMGNPGKPDSALVVIDNIVRDEPGAKFQYNMAHFTFYSLLKTDPQKALSFGREWFAKVPEPSWKTVTDAVGYFIETNTKPLPSGLYELTAISYQQQIDHYPWSMNLPDTYDKIAALYFSAGNLTKSVEASQKAVEAARSKPGFPLKELDRINSNLKRYRQLVN